jgi:hypothetical protein
MQDPSTTRFLAATAPGKLKGVHVDRLDVRFVFPMFCLCEIKLMKKLIKLQTRAINKLNINLISFKLCR